MYAAKMAVPVPAPVPEGADPDQQRLRPVVAMEMQSWRIMISAIGVLLLVTAGRSNSSGGLRLVGAFSPTSRCACTSTCSARNAIFAPVPNALHLQQRHHASALRTASAAIRHHDRASTGLALSAGAAGSGANGGASNGGGGNSDDDRKDEAAKRKEEEDKAKTYQVIMDHIANLEDVVEKGVGVGSISGASSGSSSGSSSSGGSKKKKTTKGGDSKKLAPSSSAKRSLSKTSSSSKKGSGSRSRSSKSKSSSSSGSRSKRRSKNPVQYLAGNSPPDGMNRLVFTLAFMTGVADVAMVLKYKNFATMMTGNAMWAASHVLNRSFGLAAYLFGVIGCYMAGLAIFRRTYQSLKEQSLQMFAPMITAAFLAADYMTSMNPLRKWPSMFLLSAAYGIINAVGTDMTGSLCFVITGHITKITNSIVDRYSGLAGNKSIDRPSFIRSVYVCLGFFLGAFAAWTGLMAFPGLKDRGLLSIMGTVYGALFLWQDAKNMGGWWKHKKGKNCTIDKYDAHCV